MPDGVRAKWAGRVEFISKREWDQQDPRVGGVSYTVPRVLAWGRFARVEVTLSERVMRLAGAVPAQYAAGTTYYLMELNGEWVVVALESWIT